MYLLRLLLCMGGRMYVKMVCDDFIARSESLFLTLFLAYGVVIRNLGG